MVFYAIPPIRSKSWQKRKNKITSTRGGGVTAVETPPQYIMNP
jgi:hypothetical protein